MLWKKLLTPVLCTWVCYVACAQSPAFRNYTTNSGLPSSETYCALQDSKGYMWFGTDRGLVKFDGYSFQTLTTADGMPDNTVFILQKDKLNRMWFNTYSSRLGCLTNDSILPYKYNPLVKSQIPAQVLHSWLFDNQNVLWISYSMNNLGREEFRIIRIDADGRIDSTLENNDKSTQRIYMSKKGVCVISGSLHATTAELIDLESGKTLTRVSLSEQIHFHPVAFRKGNQDIWFCINRSLFHLQNHTCKRIYQFGNDILSLMKDKQNNIWVGLLDQGVNLLNAGTHYSIAQTFLPRYSVSGMTSDREGGLWFTTLENGVYYLPPEHLFSYNETDGLTSPKVKKIVNVDGDILMILSNWDIVMKPHGSRKLELLKKKGHSPTDICYLPPGHIYYTGVDPFVFRSASKKCIPIGNMVTSIGKKFIWSSGYSHLIRHDTSGRVLEKIPFAFISRITCQFEKENGSVLIGTLDGLYEYRKGAVYVFKKYHPLLGQRISQIEQLDSTHLVLATMGQGILIVHKENWANPVQYTVEDGLAGNMCQTIRCEHDTVIWVGTTRGLSRIAYPADPGKVRFRKIDMCDGLISNEINDICVDGDTLWLGTMNGLTILPKSTLGNRKTDIPVYIEHVLVNGEPASLKGGNTFSHLNNNISFALTGINYQYGEKLLYKYRMRGTDDRWSYTNNRSILYKTLTPGSYTFEFKAIDPNRNESSATAAFTFHIRAPFWQTWWFITCTVMFLLSAIYFYIYSQIRVAKTRMQLEGDLNSYREKAMRAQMNPHFVYNSLNSIQNYILQNEPLASVSFLSKFSLLMRLTFNNSNTELVPLQKDLEALQLYTELENLRFADKFSMITETSSTIDAATTFVPPLLIQPFVENAILHGFMSKKEPGIIRLQIDKNNGHLEITITDNGVGRHNAALIKERKEKYKAIHNKTRNPVNSGIQTTVARIEQAWGKKSEKSNFKIVDLQDAQGLPCGTSVSFYLPLSYE